MVFKLTQADPEEQTGEVAQQSVLDSALERTLGYASVMVVDNTKFNIEAQRLGVAGRIKKGQNVNHQLVRWEQENNVTSMINQITTLIQTKEMAVMSTQLSNDKGDDRIDKLYEIAKMNNSMKTTKRKVTVEQLQHMIESANDDFVEIEL